MNPSQVVITLTTNNDTNIVINNNNSDDDDDDEVDDYSVPIVIAVWSRQRSSYPFREHFSEALDVLHRHGFVVKLRELSVITKKDLMGVHLLWMQGGDRRSLRDSEQQALMEHLLRGGTLLAEAFYPPDSYPGSDDGKIARKIRRSTDSLLSVFGLRGVSSRREPNNAKVALDPRIQERSGFQNRLETFMCVQPSEAQTPFRIGPFFPLFEQWDAGEDSGGGGGGNDRVQFEDFGMRMAFLSRGTFGLGQVLLVSNTHAFANQDAWLGGFIRENYHILVNLASSAAEPPPLSPEICRPHVKMATLTGNFSALIKTFKANIALDEGLEQMIMDDYNDDDEDHNDELGYDTAFHCAAATDNVPCIMFFLEEQEVPVEFQQHDMETAVHAAAREGSLRALHYLAYERNASLVAPNRRGHLPIHVCARSPRTDNLEARFEVIRWMCNDMGISVDVASTVNRSTPFFSAVAPNQPPLAMIRFLRDEMKADMHALNKDNWHPFLVACNNNDTAAVVKQLVQWGANPLEIRLERDRQNGLHRAILNGREAVAKFLVRHSPALLAEKDVNDYTCLHFACRGGHLNLVKWLLTEHRDVVDPASGDRHQKTGLHVAAIHNRNDVVAYMCETFPELLEVKAKDGWTALTFAARAGAVAVVRALAGVAKLNTVSDAPHSDTPLTIAARHMQWDVAAVLLDAKGVDHLHADEDGLTVYHFCVSKGAPMRLVCSLFALGFPKWDAVRRDDALLNIISAKVLRKTAAKGVTELSGVGQTPMTMASESGNRALTNYFLQTGPGGRMSGGGGGGDGKSKKKSARKMSDAAIAYAQVHPYAEDEEAARKSNNNSSKKKKSASRSNTLTGAVIADDDDASMSESAHKKGGVRRASTLKNSTSGTFGMSNRF